MAEADSIRLCAHCGKAEVIGHGTKQYCSPACSSASRKVKRRGYKRKPLDRSRPAHCKNCGAGFRSRPNGKIAGGWTECCSVLCAQRRRHARAGSLKPILVRTLHGHCKRCGKHFVMQHSSAKFCSPECSGTAWSPSIRPCAHCGVEFTQERRWQRTCSDACLDGLCRKHRRVAKSRRRAMTRGAEADAIDPLAVFARDGWRCQLCGVRTPKRLRGTYEDRAPELDHIVALADGGTHTWGNVQCACRKCNGAKGAGSSGQLGLPFAA